jgi:hypothetical protein
MTAIVIDEATAKATPQQAKTWGAVAVGMYVSHDPAKNATASLIRQYADAGIKSFLYYEDTAAQAADGYPQGVTDAKFALTLATSMGLPSWAPLIATADYDVPDFAPASHDPMMKLGPVGRYLQGWCDTIGKHRVAIYGGYWVVTRAIAAGVAACAVQTIAWSGGLVDLKDIACLQNGVTLDHGNADVEVIESARLLNLIAWTPGEPDPSAPPPPPRPPVGAVTWAQWPANMILKYGAKSDAVAVLQAALRNSGIRGVRGIAVDGNFGSQTLTATRNFQYVRNLPVDGIAGPRTRTDLEALKNV